MTDFSKNMALRRALHLSSCPRTRVSSERMRCCALALLVLTFANVSSTQTDILPNTARLEGDDDFAAAMVDGIDAYLMSATEKSIDQREARWSRNTSSTDAYLESVSANRDRLRHIVGAVDERARPYMVNASDALDSQPLAKGAGYSIHRARWAAMNGVHGEGLLLEPDTTPRASVVAIPDCDWTPEMLVGLTGGVPKEAQFARRLAESGCRVIVPVLIDRGTTYSKYLHRSATNMTHREFIYRGAYEMGRHLIGYEVQKVLAAIDWLESKSKIPLGVIGYGEGGLLAFYAAAIDERIDAAVVSGYFQPRENVWREPIYRNVWSLLNEFGDAEIASLVFPRKLIVEAGSHTERIEPIEMDGRRDAAPGFISTPPTEHVGAEVARARELLGALNADGNWLDLTASDGGMPGQDESLHEFLAAMSASDLAGNGVAPSVYGELAHNPERMKRQVGELVEYNQRLMRESPSVRKAFWEGADSSTVETWEATSQPFRDYFWDEVIGRLPAADVSANPRTRLVFDEPAYRGYEVVLDVYDGVIAYGILLVPKDIAEGVQRPVVVCQHGLEGRPQDLASPDIDNKSYNQYGCRLAEEGFVVYAPQNPYIGGDRFRVLQRKANPLKLSLFSFIVRQHERSLEWLAGLSFVDADRIAFYGLSYGGKTAMRVPALLDGYCLSICSADYNEWIWKNVSASSTYSYLFTPEYEMFEFNLGNTFNYAEMSWLVSPRPFMVERGHHDGVAPDEWVAYEFARTKRHYALMGIGDRAEIEFFNGPHTINGVGTFEFLHKHLNFPKR